MKLYFLLILLLSQCSLYDLSFDMTNRVVTEPIFNVLSPASELSTDVLEIKLEIGHPDGISAINIDGEFEDTVAYSSNPQYITYSKKISNKYSSTYSVEDGIYSFDVDIKTKSNEPFYTNVTLVVYRNSIDNLEISYPTEYNADGQWKTNDILQLTADETGVGIKCIIYDPTSSTTYTTNSSSSGTNITSTNYYDISVGMNKIFPDGLQQETNKTIQYVTTGDKTNSFTMHISEPYKIKMIRDNDDSVSEWLPITIYVHNPDSYSHILINSPNVTNEKINISEFTKINDNNVSLQYTFDLAYDEDYKNPKGESKPYSTADGNYNVNIELYNTSNEVVSDNTIDTNITIRRKVMDNVQVTYPTTIPSNGEWKDTDILTISADNTGDTIGTVIVTLGSYSKTVSGISAYSNSIKMSDIWDNPTSSISGSITVIPTKDITSNNTYSTNITIVDALDDSTSTGDYVSLGTYTGDPAPSDGYIYYPIIISETVYKDYVSSANVLYFYTNDNDIVQVGTTISPSSNFDNHYGIAFLNSGSSTTLYLKLLYDTNTAITHDIKIYANTTPYTLIDKVSITTPVEGDIVDGVNGITISSTITDTTYNDRLNEIEINEGYSWYKLDLNSGSIQNGVNGNPVSSISIGTGDNDNSFSAYMVYIFDDKNKNNDPTITNELTLSGDIKDDQSYFIDLPNTSTSLYLKRVYQNSGTDNSYTKLN